MGRVSEISDRYIREFATIDPVRSIRFGTDSEEPTLTDYSPAGLAAKARLFRTTLADLETAEPEDEAERLGKAYLTDMVAAELGLVESGERGRLVNAVVGPVSSVRTVFDLMDRSTDDAWARVAARLRAVPRCLQGYRASLEHEREGGRVAGHRVVAVVARQCDAFGRWFTAYVAPYGEGPLRAELDDAAVAANQAYGSLGDWMRRDYAVSADPTDGVGDDRYRVWGRAMLGTELDLDEAYAWGWEELRRLEQEKKVEADRILAGATFAEARELLETDDDRAIHGVDEYQRWLQEISDEAIEALHGSEFDIPEPLRTCRIGIPPEGSAAAPYYTPPSEDLSRPGQTWFPTLGATRFPMWDKVTTAYHEAVPGHHLQVGAIKLLPLTRAHRVGFNSAHGEGWALYAERLMDELGWFENPDRRLGFLAAQAFRAARVVVDIGLHTGRVIPEGWDGAGRRWTYELAVEHIGRASGRNRPFVESEVVRYLSLPSQATTYKLGERVWLAGREAASRRPDFDLRSWHANALALGAHGLDRLAEELPRC
jgi:uncharacterized protein (DUF885 family)